MVRGEQAVLIQLSLVHFYNDQSYLSREKDFKSPI